MKSSYLMRSILAVVLLLPVGVWAQVTGQITGTVHDNSGAVVNGAQVTVRDTAKGVDRATTTNAEGEYLVSGLPVGNYDISVTATGFKTYQAKALKLDVGQKARLDVTMAVGAVNTEVVVQGAEVAQVETQSSELSGVVSGKEITQLELNGRNFTQLVTLVPGVNNQTGQDEGTVGVYGNVSFSMNGGRTEYNNWELDGGDNMDNGSNSTLNVYPSLEAIGEFRVLTSNYGAQYGRNGSGTVEVETKAGTNSFHGNVYEFNRNDMFNARNYFNRPPDPIPGYKKNDYGYTIGGPVFIPKVYNTDKTKTFFFWSEEWRKDRVPGQNFNLPVPSVANRNGNFSDLCPDPAGNTADCPHLPGTSTAYPGNQVPFNPNDPNIQALLAMIPEPNAVGPDGVTPFYNASPVQPTNWREELIRIDQNLGSKHRATFRYIHDSWDTITATPLWTNQGSFPTIGTNFKGPGISLVTRLTSSFTPTLLNEFVFSYTTDHIILNNTGAWQRPSGATFGTLFPGLVTDIVPGIALNSAGSAYGGSFGQDPGYVPNGPYNSNPTFTFRDNVSKIVGKHNLQFGAYLVAARKNELGGELAAGSIPGLLTFDANLNPNSTGNPFADLLTEQIWTFGQQDKRIKYYNRYKIVEPYFQDDWHITPRLTLNLGLRLSLYGTYRERLHQAFNFDPAHYDPSLGTHIDPATGEVVNLTPNGGPASLTNLPNGIVQCGVTPGVPVGCMTGHLFNPAPRLGFAWDPTGTGKTAIRGGYGVFFEHTNGNEGNTESLENSPPLATTEQQTGITGYANIGAGGGAGSQPVFPLGVTSVPTKVVWPYMQQWHLDVQHEILRNTVITASYVGSKGTHLTRSLDLNQLLPVPANLNPFLVNGEAMGGNCGTLDAFGVPTNGTTPDGVPVPYGGSGVWSPAVNFGVANCGTVADPFRRFQGYTSINRLENKASSVYHAFQFSGRRQMGSFQLQLAYTYSHSIDDSSSRGDLNMVNAYDPRMNRASSNFDQRHVLNASYVWDLPFFKNPGIANKVLGGWQYSGIMTFSTGTPFTVTFAGDNAGVANGISSGSTTAYANRVGDPNANIPSVPGVLQLYNPNAYAPPIGLTFGNSGRNSLVNPNRTNFDMALFKHFAIKESVGFEFRVEAFNVFNHTQFGFVSGDGGSAAWNSGNLTSFTADLTGSNFLQVLTAHNPRILQLGAKFIF